MVFFPLNKVKQYNKEALTVTIGIVKHDNLGGFISSVLYDKTYLKTFFIWTYFASVKYNQREMFIDWQSAKYNPRENFKNWPSAKLNPRKKSKIWRPRKLVRAKINLLKVSTKTICFNYWFAFFNSAKPKKIAHSHSLIPHCFLLHCFLPHCFLRQTISSPKVLLSIKFGKTHFYRPKLPKLTYINQIWKNSLLTTEFSKIHFHRPKLPKLISIDQIWQNSLLSTEFSETHYYRRSLAKLTSIDLSHQKFYRPKSPKLTSINQIW